MSPSITKMVTNSGNWEKHTTSTTLSSRRASKVARGKLGADIDSAFTSGELLECVTS